MDLHSPLRMGALRLENRIVMAPMTRSRAVDGNVPHPLANTYYAQRASAGLIITEASQVSPQGVGYVRTPGIHSADQGTNQRTDGYGGSISNRTRLPLEVTDAVVDVWGPERVGYRISPNGTANSMRDSNPAATFSHLVKELDRRRLAFVHVRETIAGPQAVPEGSRLTPRLRALFTGAMIANGGYDLASGAAAVRSELADAVAYGVLFLANPDLPRRFRERAPLNEPDPATFCAGEENGYIDYPTLEESLARRGAS